MKRVVGISAGYHDSGCTVIRDGKLLAAVFQLTARVTED